jgi:hypothetical protein
MQKVSQRVGATAGAFILTWVRDWSAMLTD